MKTILHITLVLAIAAIYADARGLRPVRLLQGLGSSLPIKGDPEDCTDYAAALNQTVYTFNERNDTIEFEQLLNRSNLYSNSINQLRLALLEAKDILELIAFQNRILETVPIGVIPATALNDILANLSIRYDNLSEQIEEIYNNSNIEALNDLLFPYQEQLSVLFGFNDAVQSKRMNSTECANLSICIAIYDSYLALKNANLSIKVDGLDQDVDYYAAVNDFINKELGPVWTLKDEFFDTMFVDYIYADLSNYNASKYSNNSFRRAQAEEAAHDNATNANDTQSEGDNNETQAADGVQDQNQTADNANGTAQDAGQRRMLQENDTDSGDQDQNATDGDGAQANASQSNDTQADNNQTDGNSTDDPAAANATQKIVKIFPTGSGRMKAIDVLKSANHDLMSGYIDFIVSFNDFIEAGLEGVIQTLTDIAESPAEIDFPALIIDIPLEEDPVRINAHYINDIRQCINNVNNYPLHALIDLDNADI